MPDNRRYYVALPWPEYQDYMSEDWFREESYYDVNKDTYLIPKERYKEYIRNLIKGYK